MKDIKISNVKGILIFLVVFGHFIEIYKSEYYELFVFIYSFHMPLFILISGYLAKRMRVGKIMNLILLYLIFQTFFNLVLYLTGDYDSLQFTYGTPHYHLWYIVSLGFWYGITLIIDKLKLNTVGKWVIFITIFATSYLSRWYTDAIVDIVRGYYDNFSSYTLSYQRTLSFMPFFFLGYFLNKKWLTLFYNSIKNRLITLVLLIITMLITFLYVESSYGIESVFRGSFGIRWYLDDGDGFSIYLLKVTIHYMLAFGVCYLLFNLISSEENIFTRWGDRSLSIFLFHPVFIFIIRQTTFMNDWSPDTKIVAFLLMAIIITVILGSQYFSRTTKYICNPYNTISKLLKRR